ncbi:MAG: sodium-dependent bicarbonate transport family permease [Thermoflexales bacterium]|nr:sodium-dependent bicarbonate transport family permease [Thermoflexales bacterium]MDW8350535.1 sodium-dependent bicarbonate transport family permease [Anaerolineae bacterium]
MDTLEIIRTSFLSPLVLAFVVGIIATLIKSELEFPQPVLNAISIYLVFSIALKGGTELAAAGLERIVAPALATALLVVFIPSAAYFLARRFIQLDIPNAAGIAALYGSVSSVTFFAALSLAEKLGSPAEPFMPVLVSLMEWAILVALFIARWRLRRAELNGNLPISEIVIDTLRGRSVILLLGGLFIGAVIGEAGFRSVKPFFDDPFRGVLTLFLLEMGMVAGRQLREFFRLGPRLLAFGVIFPLFNGLLGTTLGVMAGLSPSGSFVLGAITASASYIDAPAAVRAALPQANPSIYLTSSLGITFPFNLVIGLPLYYQFAVWLHGLMR